MIRSCPISECGVPEKPKAQSCFFVVTGVVWRFSRRLQHWYSCPLSSTGMEVSAESPAGHNKKPKDTTATFLLSRESFSLRRRRNRDYPTHANDGKTTQPRRSGLQWDIIDKPTSSTRQRSSGNLTMPRQRAASGASTSSSRSAADDQVCPKFFSTY